MPAGARACCIGDYDNDGYDDLFVTYFGKNVLYHNNGDGTFTDVTRESRRRRERQSAGTRVAPSSITTATASSISSSRITSISIWRPRRCRSRPVPLQGRDGRVRAARTDGRQEHSVPQQWRRHVHRCIRESRHLEANGTYGLGVLTADFDNDGWPDIYVANDSTASVLYQNKKNGKFEDIAIEAGCALSAGRQAASRHGRFRRRLRTATATSTS